MEQRYKITEIFHSLQGEGLLRGRPMTFVRFFGCNLKCDFCDERQSVKQFKEMDVNEIMNKARYKWICLTGGEPFLYDLSILVKAMRERGYKIQIETNGSLPTQLNLANVYITCSPKRYTEKVYGMPYYVHPMIRDGVDEFKFIVDEAFQIEEIENFLKDNNKLIFLQPCNFRNRISKSNLEKSIDLVMRENLILSDQSHKYWRIK